MPLSEVAVEVPKDEATFDRNDKISKWLPTTSQIRSSKTLRDLLYTKTANKRIYIYREKILRSKYLVADIEGGTLAEGV